jgi:hypothetical protein
MKIGDLVSVGMTPNEKPFVSIIMEICLPEEHQNGLHLIQVLQEGGPRWYPVGYVKVINESR